MNRFVKLLYGLCIGILFLSFSFNGEATAVEMEHPQLVVESYEIVDGKFEKSAECILRIHIKNVDESNVATAGDITIYSAYVYPVTGKTNQVSFGEIEPGESIDVNFEVNLDKIVNGPNLIEIALRWNDENSVLYSNNVNISPVLLEEVGFEITSVNIPGTLYGTKQTKISISYENVGSENLKNVYMILDGDIAQGMQVVELEDISIGKKEMLDYSLELLNTGRNQIDISFRYEDRNGNEYSTEPVKVNVNVTDEAYIPPSEQETDIKALLEEYRVYVIYGVAAVLLWIPFMVSLIKKGGKKR